jgi:uncharacterized protein
LVALAAWYGTNPARGEITVLSGPPEDDDAEDLDGSLRAALKDHSVREAAALVTAATGLPRKVVYARAYIVGYRVAGAHDHEATRRRYRRYGTGSHGEAGTCASRGTCPCPGWPSQHERHRAPIADICLGERNDRWNSRRSDEGLEEWPLMRVVIDTNILISFAIRPNRNFERIFDHVAAHGVSLVSEDTLTELFDVLTRDKFRKYIPLDQSIDYVEWYAAISEQIIVTDHIIACHDPKDDKFLSIAVSGQADCIIAGDHHLLDMIQFNGIPVYSPVEFISLFIK